MTQIETFTDNLKAHEAEFRVHTNTTDQVVEIHFVDEEVRMLVGFDSAGRCADLHISPSLFKFANTTEGYASDSLIRLSEALLAGKYDCCIGQNIFNLVSKATITVDIGGSDLFVGKTWVGRKMARAIRERRLFRPRTKRRLH